MVAVGKESHGIDPRPDSGSTPTEILGVVSLSRKPDPQPAMKNPMYSTGFTEDLMVKHLFAQFAVGHATRPNTNLMSAVLSFESSVTQRIRKAAAIMVSFDSNPTVRWRPEPLGLTKAVAMICEIIEDEPNSPPGGKFENLVHGACQECCYFSPGAALYWMLLTITLLAVAVALFFGCTAAFR